MKRISSLIVCAAILLGAAPAPAKTETRKEEKNTTAASPKGAAGINKNDPTAKAKTTAREDSLATDPEFHFYVSKKKRNINLQDLYVGTAAGILSSAASESAIYKNGAALNGSYGIPMVDKYLVMEFNNNADILFNRNNNWFANAFSMPSSQIRGGNIAFSNEFTLGLHVVIAGSKKCTWTAGVQAGGKLFIMPSVTADGYTGYISAPMSLCYGMKTNVFVADKFYCFAQYSNALAASASAYTSQPLSDYTQNVRSVSVNYGVVRIGVGYIFKPWW